MTSRGRRPAPKNRARSSRAYQLYRAEVFATAPRCPLCRCPHCVLCAKPVQMWRPYRDLAGKVDLLSPSLQHTVPLNKGGHVLEGGAVAHLGCNIAAGDRLPTDLPTPAELRAPARHF